MLLGFETGISLRPSHSGISKGSCCGPEVLEGASDDGVGMRRAQSREVEEGLGKVGWPERKEHRKGVVGPHCPQTVFREAHSLSPTAQAFEAVSPVPDTPEQWMMAVR